MKPRSTPTSPKASQQIDHLYSSGHAFQRPFPSMGRFVFLSLACSIIFSVAAVVGLVYFGERFPHAPLLSLFNRTTEQSERVIIRERERQAENPTHAVAEKVGPSLGMLIRSGTKGSFVEETRLGYAAFLTTDGVGIALSTMVPDDGSTVMTMFDSIKRPITKIGRDSATPLALFRVAQPTTPLPLSDIDSLAIGSPLWVLRNDRYHGGVAIVSASVATPREQPDTSSERVLFESSDTISRRIRLDAVLDVSWVGSAVVDAEGKLVGLVSQSATGAAPTVIPVWSFRNLLTRFSRDGTMNRPTFGVTFYDLSYTSGQPELPRKGVFVQRAENSRTPAVTPRSAADTSGIKEGDVLVSVDATPLNEITSFSELINSFEPGAKVTIKLQRKKQLIEVVATLGSSLGRIPHEDR